ncbi:Sodium channel protein Nach [Frankliniella fusca]|uniref:Sodium channel protein Nach n=1 Tax=Frankliniella fusca TaxID=407009 RepID=A0AAE1LHW3_9NEOP|nr:Sodium channel protein Nach [Frankliniella fusca]
MLWAAATLLSGALLLTLSWMQYQNYVHAPTVTTIEENNLPTHSIPFPAVTLCPSRRLREDVLVRAIGRYLHDNLSVKNMTLDPEAVATASQQWAQVTTGLGFALNHYRYPNYRLMNFGLRLVGSRLVLLDGFAISQIMMQGRITCGDILAHCYWRGVAFSCCEQFQLQRTEMGYCMSFNSRTSTGPKILCTEKNCHHVWSTGPGTGLDLVFKRPENFLSHIPVFKSFKRKTMNAIGLRPDTNPDFRPQTLADTWESEDLFMSLSAESHRDTILVMVHDRETFPDVTLAHIIPTLERVDISMAVAFTGTAAGKELKNVPADVRKISQPFVKHEGETTLKCLYTSQFRKVQENSDTFREIGENSGKNAGVFSTVS